MAWKTVKAIVEMTVNGPYSERQFKYDVQEALDHGLIESSPPTDVKVGKITVKSAKMSEAKQGQFRTASRKKRTR